MAVSSRRDVAYRRHAATARDSLQPGIIIDIDALVLEGLTPGEAERIGHSLRAELARLIAERGVPDGVAGLGAVDRLPQQSAQLPARASAARTGRLLAGAVYGALGGVRDYGQGRP